LNLVEGKVMLILVFDAEGIILHSWVLPGQIAGGQYYVRVLRRDFRNAIGKKRPNFSGERKWFLLQENSRPRTAKVAMYALTEIDGTH
jgi:hypothetical protein